MISDIERRKMRKARYMGDTMVGYLDMIGIERLSDLADQCAEDLALRIDEVLGRNHLSTHSLAIQALENVIELAMNEE